LPADADILLSALDGRLALDPEELRNVPSEERLDLVLRRARKAGALPPDFGLADARRYLDVYKANRRASQSYRLGTYPGSAVLFRAAAEPEETGDETIGWRQNIQGGLTVVPLPATHNSLIEPPHVEAIAAWITSAED
jgi:thioesterase domain-containing protein